MSNRFGPRTRTLGAIDGARVATWATRQRQVRIKSIQRNVCPIAATQQSGTFTITAVDLANSRIKFLGFTTASGDAGSNPSKVLPMLELTNATTVTATRLTSDATYGRSVRFEVIEYYPGVIKSVQRQTITLSAVLSNTATLSPAVDVTKTEIDFLGFMTNQATFNASIFGLDVALTNGTTVTATVSNAAAIHAVSFQATEWY